MPVHLWEVEALARKKQEGKASQPFSVINKTKKSKWLHPMPLSASLGFGNQKVHQDELPHFRNTQYTFTTYSLVAEALWVVCRISLHGDLI